MNVSFRKAQISDADAIARNIFPGYDPQDVYENLELCLKDEDIFMLVGEVDGKIVSHAHLELMGAPREHVVRIYSFIVAENERRKGIGKRMMEFIENWARKNELELILLEVYPDNHAAISFYTNQGFVRYGYLPRGSKFRNGQYSDEILMYKWLKKASPSEPREGAPPPNRGRGLPPPPPV